MKKRILHCGIDVDGKTYAICLMDNRTGEIYEHRSKPNIG